MNDRLETRTVTTALQVRDVSGSDGFTFSGYAALWDVPYQVNDFMGSYTETFRKGAFTRALSNGADVRLLVDHSGVPLARSKSGTLSLREDETGLYAEANLDSSSPLAQTVRSAMQRGDLNQMSHQFAATRQKWDASYENRDIYSANLYDVSIVTFPANNATSATIRSDADCWARQAAIFDRASRQIRAGQLDGPTRDLLLQMLGAIDAGTEAIEDAVEVLEEILGVAPESDFDDVEEMLEPDMMATDASQNDPGIGPMRSNIEWLRLQAAALSL
jgi:HK97 family phage prohead protease